MDVPTGVNPEKLIPVGDRISWYGLCERDEVHPGHLESLGGNRWHLCHGQWSQCRNCDDVLCMDCRTRTMHEECIRDCPVCC